jgi:L-ornithine Nalpha-acyltransferase
MAETAKLVLHPQRLEVGLALKDGDTESAYRLRYRVFVEEEHNLQLLNCSALETDQYDAYCDHLIVKDLETEQVVGTYRLLPGDRAAAHIGFYSESEFELGEFRSLAPRTLELGRSCIAPEYRTGRAIRLLWEGIMEYAERIGTSYMIGCASIHSRSKTELDEVYSLLHSMNVITDRYGVRPLSSHVIKDLKTIAIAGSEKEIFRRLPPLMKGYQWLGAEIGGDPAYDPIFDTVDYFVVLHKEKMSRRYLRKLQSDPL